MVGVAQLVEPRIVIPVVVGSSPIVHPIFASAARLSLQRHAAPPEFRGCIGLAGAPTGPLAQLAEQRTLNPQVVGSIPTRPTKLPARDRREAVSSFWGSESKWGLAPFPEMGPIPIFGRK